MQPTNHQFGQTNHNAGQTQTGLRRFLGMGCLMPVLAVGLVLAMCAFAAITFVPTATVISLAPNATRTPLPRLTATALPTLTPTAGPVDAAGRPISSSSAFSPSGVVSAQDNAGNAAVAQLNSAPAPAVNPAQNGGNASSAYAPAQNNSASPYSTSPGRSSSAYNPATGSGGGTASSPFATSPQASPTSGAAKGGSGGVVLPPTASAPTATPTPAPTKIPTATPLPPTATPLPVVDAPPINETEWTFTGLRTDTSQLKRGMMLYGNLVNNAATPQELNLVTATFYDSSGNVIAERKDISAYWPGNTVPADGGSMPFQLLVNGIEGASDFDLNLGASTDSRTPRQDFEFTDVYQSYGAGGYCVDGYLHNNGNPLQEYLVITVVLYDDEDNVINFQDEQIAGPTRIVGDRAYDFRICVGSPFDDVSRYEVQAWGY